MNQEKCIQCAENTYQPSKGSTSCLTCPSGQEPNGTRTGCDGRVDRAIIVSCANAMLSTI